MRAMLYKSLKQTNKTYSTYSSELGVAELNVAVKFCLHNVFIQFAQVFIQGRIKNM